MALIIQTNNTALGTKGILATNGNDNDNRRNVFAGNFNVGGNDPIAEKRTEAQKKAIKVIGDAWNTDKEIDRSIDERRAHYENQIAIKKEAQSQIGNINEQIDALKKEYGVTEDMTYRECPAEFRQRYSELKDQADSFYAEIYEADKLIRDDLADIRAIGIERLKSSPMAEAQETAENIEEAANKQIVDIAMQEGKDKIEEESKEREEKAEEKAQKQKLQDEKLEKIQEERALREAMIEQTKESVEEAKAKNRENNTSDIPLEDLVKIAKSNSETSKAQKTLKEIKNSMSLLEADLTGIEVDTEV